MNSVFQNDKLIDDLIFRVSYGKFRPTLIIGITKQVMEPDILKTIGEYENKVNSQIFIKLHSNVFRNEYTNTCT